MSNTPWKLEPPDALRRLGVVADASQLRAVCDHWAIRKAVRDGSIVRAGPRRYALPGTTDTLLAAARLGGVVSHLSAAIYWGWPVKSQPDRPHVTIPRRRARSAEARHGVQVYWADLPAEDIHQSQVTSPVRTVVDCARSLPLDEALSVADSALRQESVTRERLREAAQRLPRTGRTRALAVVEMADGRADNPFESCLRALASTVPGLQVTPQFQIADIGRADLVDEHLRLVVEAESIAFHNSEQSFRRDIRRYTAMVCNGWRVVRFCWEDVMFRQGYVREVLLALVRAGPPHRGQLIQPFSDRRLGGGA